MATRLYTKQVVIHHVWDRASYKRGSTATNDVDQGTWDAELGELGGHLLQSWRWGELKRRGGWQVERVRVAGTRGRGMAQVLFRPHGPVTTAFLPRGPVISGDHEAVLPELLAAIDVTCHRHRVLTLGIEPGLMPPLSDAPDRFGFVTCLTRYSPRRTVIVPLLGDDALLKQMSSTTRQNVRRAQRDGVIVNAVPPDEHGINAFYALLRETATRHDFPIRPLAHYRDALRIFGNDAVLLIASVGGTAVAGRVAIRFRDEAISLFSASATVQPTRGAAALLMFEAFRWARSVGCSRYDLWGICKDPREKAEDGSLDRTTKRECAPDNGICGFKIGFGGEIIVLPRRIERHYHPHLEGFLRRAHDVSVMLRH